MTSGLVIEKIGKFRFSKALSGTDTIRLSTLCFRRSGEFWSCGTLARVGEMDLIGGAGMLLGHTRDFMYTIESEAEEFDIHLD
jgi:hypothetical protein